MWFSGRADAAASLRSVAQRHALVLPPDDRLSPRMSGMIDDASKLAQHSYIVSDTSDPRAGRLSGTMVDSAMLSVKRAVMGHNMIMVPPL